MTETVSSSKETAVPHVAPTQTHTLSMKERIDMGKEARKRIPREMQAEWTPPKNRVDPIDLLMASSEGRIEELASRYRLRPYDGQPLCFLSRFGVDHGL